LVVAGSCRATDLDEATEKAMKNAMSLVAPTIVKIETAGGAELVGERGQGGGVRKGTGPTTGVIVDPDGYIITSSFNFANKPTDIFVTVPGQPKRLVARVIASDLTRMLTLLKVDAHGLPVPRPFNKSEVEVGMWSLALGRTQDPEIDHPPSMSIGIVSAVNRIWGKAIQTDAKTSPVNYGGPLVAIDGRVFGVIVPASSRSEGETAGVDFYDSGIGFAIPMEDVFAVVPRLKEGKDIRRGLLGIGLKSTDKYTSAPTIGTVQPSSAAAKAGIKPGDTILEINGKPIPNFSTLQHVLGPMYEGDVVSLKIKRDDKEIAVKNVRLQGTETAEVNAFLGVLPIRDDPGPGVEIRYVYPNSPADGAGLKMGDRVMKLAPASVPALSPVQNRAALMEMIESLTVGAEVKIEVKRKDGGKTETVTLKLAASPSDLPEKLPMPSSAQKALEAVPKKKDGKEFLPKDKAPEECSSTGDDKKEDAKKDDKPKVETGFLKRTNEALGRDYWLYVPEDYDPNISYGLIVWFHDVAHRGKDGEVMKNTFQEVCEKYHFIIMGPRSGNATGWLPSETELVVQDVRAVMGDYTIDKSRVVAHGIGNGGQMAYYLGFNARDLFRGVAVLGAVLGTTPKENIAKQPLSFFIAGGDKDPLLKDIIDNKTVLQEKRFPVIFREMKESGKEYYDQTTFTDMILWLDSLDKI
jgi:S1-C subfamily serine protease/predicted esterase